MKVVAVDDKENVKLKLWGNFACKHDLRSGIFEAIGDSGTILYSAAVRCVFEDELSETIKVQEK